MGGDCGPNAMNDECAWRCDGSGPSSIGNRTRVTSTLENLATNSNADAFCSPFARTDMYMQGFTSIATEGRACVILFFREWVLDTKLKFIVACVGVCLLGVLTQGLISVRSSMQKATGDSRIVGSLMFGLNVVVGWFMMLVAMTYSVELFSCATVGLVVGNFLFAHRENTQILGSPCCNAVNDKPPQSMYTELAVRVAGMTCSGCAKTIENAVMGIPGAVSCLVSVQEGRAVTRFRSPPATASSIIDAIEAVGFEATPEAADDKKMEPYPNMLQASLHHSANLHQPLLAKATSFMVL